MSLSFPSQRVTVADVPEVSDFRAVFHYNFFTPDESVTDSGIVPDKLKLLPAESFDAARIDNLKKRVPRFVKFEFSKVAMSQKVAGNEFIAMSSEAKKQSAVSIKDNIDRIQVESDFSTRGFVGFEFQDDNIDRKLLTIVSGSIAKLVASKNRDVGVAIDAEKQKIINSLSNEYSLLDAAKATAAVSDVLNPELIVNALNQIDALKLTFIDDQTQRAITSEAFSRVRDVSVRGQISSKIVGRVVKNVVNDPMSTFADEFSRIQRRAKTEQVQAIARTNPNVISRDEFETRFNHISVKTLDAHDTPSMTRIVGYIIDKFEVDSGGKLIEHRPIIIENADASSAVDFDVAYGRTYVYAIRTIAEIRARVTIDDSAAIVTALGLISSRKSPRVFVNCHDVVPPSAPVDFNIVWDFKRNAPRLMWSFPVNPQRDIKHFQVFRRRSINEPFELIKQYSFDDSQVKTQSLETPAPSLVETITAPMTTFLDHSFRKDDQAIYSVCSIDAHGLSSNYSIQFHVTFDTFKNRVIKKLVSFSGAPKSYPNMYLNNDMFVDSMKTSRHNRVRVFFDPEYLSVTDVHQNDLRLLSTKNRDGGRYRLQFLNTDLAEQEVIDININDARLTKDRR